MSSSVVVQSKQKQKLMEMLRKMLTIRRFEERVKKEFAATKVKGFVHLYIGEEAVAVGVCSNLTKDDYVTSTHRGHGHCIAKGVDVNGMMAELFGKKTGTCKGKGGSMHIADVELGMLGANGIVGAGAPIAVGAGLSAKYRKSGQVAVSFFSDGALNQGALHEAMNIASIWKLPVIFVCENNQFAESTPIKYATSVKDPTPVQPHTASPLRGWMEWTSSPCLKQRPRPWPERGEAKGRRSWCATHIATWVTSRETTRRTGRRRTSRSG